MTNYKEILRMYCGGYSQRTIASSLGCSRDAVALCIRRAKERKLSLPVSENVTNEELREKLYNVPLSSGSSQYLLPDFELLSKELQKVHVTKGLLWTEYLVQANSQGLKGYSLSQFNFLFRQWNQINNPSLRQNHNPGEALELDWSGSSILLSNRLFEETIKCHLFVAAFPFSGELNANKGEGSYYCKQCGSPLFYSDAKFDSGSGWPSFDEALPNAVSERGDSDGVRIEALCATCGGHLGHLFRGERFTPRNKRYCVNSIALEFRAGPPQSEAVYAGGCFWGVEYLFNKLEGVISVTSGYTGGDLKNPTTATIVLDQEVGSGSIAITYQWEAEQTNTGSVINFRLFDSANKEVAGITSAIDFEAGEATFSGTVAAGFYTVMVSIESGGEVVGGLVESLRVIDQTLSQGLRTIEIGKLVDLGVITIVDGTIPPFDGEVTLSSSDYGLGDPLTLTLTASVELSPYSLQWYCEGVPLEGETNTTLVLDSLQGGS
jgi:methionine-R-sulfoxide reductase